MLGQRDPLVTTVLKGGETGAVLVGNAGQGAEIAYAAGVLRLVVGVGAYGVIGEGDRGEVRTVGKPVHASCGVGELHHAQGHAVAEGEGTAEIVGGAYEQTRRKRNGGGQPARIQEKTSVGTVGAVAITKRLGQPDPGADRQEPARGVIGFELIVAGHREL